MSPKHPKPIFVYGTLLSGEHNHHVLTRARPLGEATTAPGFELRFLGAYPAMVAAGCGAIVGELYEVDATTLCSLDALEGHPSFYRRTCITLASGVMVEAYLLHPHQVRHSPVITSGDWRRYRKERASCRS